MLKIFKFLICTLKEPFSVYILITFIYTFNKKNIILLPFCLNYQLKITKRMIYTFISYQTTLHKTNSLDKPVECEFLFFTKYVPVALLKHFS